MFWTKICPVAALLVAIAQPCSAQPQTQSSDSQVCAESESSEWLYGEANKALEKGYFRGALEFSQAAFAESHCARHLVQLAIAEQGLRRWRDAVMHMRTALNMNDEWIQKYKVPLLDDQRKMEEQLVLAGGRNEDTTLVPLAPPRMPSKVKAGWGLLFGGLIVGATAVGTLSVALAFNYAVDPFRNDWKSGAAVYERSEITGGVLLVASGLSVAIGTTLLALSFKERARQVQISMRPANADDGSIVGGAL
jgi:hypothetical protein